MQGEYHWHKHDNDDEFFFVLEGHSSLTLKTDRSIYSHRKDSWFQRVRAFANSASGLSLCPERRQRIDARGTPGRHRAGQGADEYQDGGSGGERGRIVRRQSIEQR